MALEIVFQILPVLLPAAAAAAKEKIYTYAILCAAKITLDTEVSSKQRSVILCVTEAQI